MNNMQCDFCGCESPAEVEMIDHRSYTIILCCGELRELYDDISNNQDLLKGFLNHYCVPFEDLYGSSIDKIIIDGTGVSGHKNFHTNGFEGVMFSTKLRVEPITFKQMTAFVDKHHRHTKAPRGWKFGIGCYNGAELIGVASIGRPVARMLDDGMTLEVNRLCINPNLNPILITNACSKLYGESAKRVKKLKIGRQKDAPQLDENGKVITYTKIITYTLKEEKGISLKAVGWNIEHEQKSGGSWSSESRKRKSKPTDGVIKIRWGKMLN